MYVIYNFDATNPSSRAVGKTMSQYQVQLYVS